MLTVAIRGPLAAKMRELAESTGLSLAKVLGDMVLVYEGAYLTPAPIISQLGGVARAPARPLCAHPSNHPHRQPNEIPLACAIMDPGDASECPDRVSREDSY